MKRYRHYNKESAIILSCFGSVIEQKKYLEFKEFIEKSFSQIDVFLSFSSKMVIKELQKNKEVYKNLPQVMADVEMLGYKRYVVASINIFPTDEHELLIKTVKGFQNFSLANIRYSNPLIQKTKESSIYLKNLDERIRKEDPDVINLYIIHGVPVLNLAGLEAVRYASDFLKLINEKNLTCSLEGEFPFFAVKDAIKRDILKLTNANKDAKVNIVPLLLVSGNHYDNDMKEICNEVGKYCKATIVKSFTKDEKFNLIEQDEVKEIFKTNISIELTKLGL